LPALQTCRTSLVIGPTIDRDQSMCYWSFMNMEREET
jgi:hypothetical protein